MRIPFIIVTLLIIMDVAIDTLRAFYYRRHGLTKEAAYILVQTTFVLTFYIFLLISYIVLFKF